MALLETKDLTYVYGEGTPFRAVALDNVNITIEKGDMVGLIGHTGSGKSTLLQHLNGLLTPSKGQILLSGEDIHKSKEALRATRFRVGLCFQYPEYQLFESTSYKDIAFGPKNMGLTEQEINLRVLKAAEFVGLTKAHLQKSPFDLSGGEKRRVAIAGVMAMEPEILILDEPTAGLDPKGRDTISAMIENYRQNTGNAVIIASHSMDDVAENANKVIVMNGGKVALCGTVDEVYKDVDTLLSIGLDVPQITEIFIKLREKGVDVKTDIYSLAGAEEELLRLFKERGVRR